MLHGIRKVTGILLILVVLAAAAIVGCTIYYTKNPTEDLKPKRDVFIPLDGSVYYDENGVEGKNLWLTKDDRKYYVGEDGRLIKGKKAEIGGKTYLFNEDCVLVTSQEFFLEGDPVRIDADGVLTEVRNGWFNVDGNRYYIGETGTLLKGWVITEDGKDYYLGSDGLLVTDSVFLYQGKIRQAGKDGVMTTASGWQKVDDVTYYADRDGKIVRNARVESDGNYLYLNEDGQVLKNGFYTWEDQLYYATADGTTRMEEGWITVDGKEYCSAADGTFYHGQYLTVDGKKVFIDRYGAKVDGKPTIDQYLCCDDIYGWMTDHFSDYYFKTPYRDLYDNVSRPERLIQPYGIYGENGGMNCTGFISSLVYYSGGDLSKVSAMGRFGGYGNADNYLMLATKGVVKYEVFKSVKDLLASGKAKKGNIFYLAPKWKSGLDCHMGVFWGDTPSENKLWSQTYATKCTVTEIYMIDPINQIYMFPIARNLEEDGE